MHAGLPADSECLATHRGSTKPDPALCLLACTTAPPNNLKTPGPRSSVGGRAGRPSRRRAPSPGLAGVPGGGVDPAGRSVGLPSATPVPYVYGPDRRALKQANNSSQTRLYTAFLSALPRALRHSFPSGTCNADSTLRQLRRAWFRPAESLQGSLRSPTSIGIDAAGKSTKHDDAANLVTQACSGHPLGSSECRI